MARAQELRLVGNGRGFLILALVAGLVAAALVFVAVSNSSDDNSSSSNSGATVPAVVAASNLSAGSTISADSVKVIQVPNNLALAGVFTDAQTLVGQVTNVDIAAGQQILPSQVGSKVEGKGLGYVIPAGMRGIGVPIGDESAVGGLLLPGDRVDVVATFKIGDGDFTNYKVVTVLQNLEVLAVEQTALEAVPVGQSTDGAASQDASGRVPDDVKTNSGGNTAVLLLAPDQAQLLLGVEAKASSVSLVQRSAGDKAPAQIAPSDIGSLVPESIPSATPVLQQQ
jgi:pilus assembly protein CpaB